MKKTLSKSEASNVTVDTVGLANLLSCGRRTAEKIGRAAGAEIRIGKRVLWNLPKIRKYLDSVSE